jgi:hypothetical protein
MQVEFSPIAEVMVGANYAYYEPNGEAEGLNLLQIACGLFIIQITWVG